jgi:hypothetical protein
MSEQLEMALEWMRDLGARGISVSLRKNRLWLQPASAYRHLTDDQLIFLRHHRDAIKDAVRAGNVVASVDSPVSKPDEPIEQPEQVAPSQPLCRYCGNRPCVGSDHPAYATFHWLDPIEVKKRDDYATRVMWQQLGKTSPYL